MIERRQVVAGLVLALVPGLGARAAEDMATRILELSNAARRQAGLAPFAASNALMRAAQGHAQAMARAGRLDHKLGGNDPVKRARAQGYAYARLAENIAMRTTGRLDGEGFARHFVGSWLGSPPHRRNLLDPALADAGIGVASNGAAVYAVQMLGRRRG